MLLRRRYETWLPKADRRRLRHISILLRTATAWLQLYGLLLYSCLRTGTGTCSRMPIRQPWLTQLALAGALPAASIPLCCRLVLRWVSKGAPTFFFLKCPLAPLKQLQASKPLQTPGWCSWFVRELSGVTTDRPENIRGRIRNSRMRRVQKGCVWHVPTTWQTHSVLSIICFSAMWPTLFFDAVFCVLWLMHVLLVAFLFFFTPKKFILLLIGYKLSVDNTFLLGVLWHYVSSGVICDFWCLFFIKMIIKINGELD